MAVQGFFSPDRKTRMAGEKENNAAFSVKVEPVKVANNVNQYNEQTPSLDYAPDRVGEYIRESETKSYTPKKDTSYVSADSYKPDVKTADQMYGEGFKKQEEKRTQFYNAVNKDLNVDSYGEAKLAPGIERTFRRTPFGDNYTYLKDGQLVTRKEKKEIEKDMALRTQLGQFVKDREWKEMSALRDAERASYEKNMPDPDDRKIDFYTGAVFPGEKVKPFEQRKFDYQRENIRYGTAEDGTPTGTISGSVNYGEDAAKVYGTEQLKKFIAADAKQDFENKEGGYAQVDEGPREINSFEKFFMGLPGMRERENKALSQLSTSQLVQRDKENYGSTFPKGSFGTEKTRLEKAKEEQENRNVFQKIGDAVGDAFNKLTGTEAAAAGTLQAQGINTGATTNLSRINNVNPTVQKARQAVEKSVRRQTGMSSNPGSQRQTGVGKSAGDLSRHKTGRSTSRGGISKSTSRGQGGGTSSRSRGGVSRGGSKSNTGSKSSARGARGSAGSRSRGGTGSGRTSTSRTASKASRSRTGRSRTRCDIRTKIDISPLINSNLVRDNLAELAYFVQEIKK